MLPTLKFTRTWFTIYFMHRTLRFSVLLKKCRKVLSVERCISLNLNYKKVEFSIGPLYGTMCCVHLNNKKVEFSLDSAWVIRSSYMLETSTPMRNTVFLLSLNFFLIKWSLSGFSFLSFYFPICLFYYADPSTHPHISFSSVFQYLKIWGCKGSNSCTWIWAT